MRQYENPHQREIYIPVPETAQELYSFLISVYVVELCWHSSTPTHLCPGNRDFDLRVLGVETSSSSGVQMKDTTEGSSSPWVLGGST